MHEITGIEIGLDAPSFQKKTVGSALTERLVETGEPRPWKLALMISHASAVRVVD